LLCAGWWVCGRMLVRSGCLACIVVELFSLLAAQSLLSSYLICCRLGIEQFPCRCQYINGHDWLQGTWAHAHLSYLEASKFSHKLIPSLFVFFPLKEGFLNLHVGVGARWYWWDDKSIDCKKKQVNAEVRRNNFQNELNKFTCQRWFVSMHFLSISQCAMGGGECQRDD